MLADFRVVSTLSRRTETSTILRFEGFYKPVGLKNRLLNAWFLRRALRKKSLAVMNGTKRVVEGNVDGASDGAPQADHVVSATPRLTICYNRPMRPRDCAPRPAHLKWLLDSDPSIRWQVMRDLTDEAPNAIAEERSRVATVGWGAKLLARQSRAGNWGEPNEDRGLLITLYSLVALMDLGLDPASKQARKMIDRVDRRLVFKPLDDRPFLHGETEPCINGRILALGAYFNKPNRALANQLLREQLEDGGWNCEAVEPSPKRPKSRRSSFHTTICVLEGLLAYEREGRKSAAVTKARKRGENYLLERRMFRSLRTGEVIDVRWLRFSFPTFWHYDVLRGLDYLRNAGVKPDRRVREAIETVIKRRHQNGRWPLNLLHREQIPLEMETAVGSASRWNTLRALRVLRWYNDSTW